MTADGLGGLGAGDGLEGDGLEGTHEQNRRSWNAVTGAHNSHKIEQGRFLMAGGSTLFAEEVELLGDVAGKRVAHLQCNCGQDSLSLVGLGAAVTGVDIADAAIGFARGLAAETGIEATFHRADVLDWLAATGDRFDVAFSTYGGVGWIGDLGAWAAGAAVGSGISGRGRRGLRGCWCPGGGWCSWSSIPWSGAWAATDG